jgi:RsiW-degrading membrane proteinase PrsW (M82 family)
MSLLAFPYAVIPMVVFMIVVRRLDRYDPEPLWLLLTHFFWGAFGALILSQLVSSKMIGLIWGKAAVEAPPKIAAVLIGPPVEELMKAAIFLLTIRLRDFNNLTDGIVYGATVGFGFAMTENFLYFLPLGDIANPYQYIAYRTFFSGMMHALACGTLGAFLGYAQFAFGYIPFLYIIFGIAPAILLHTGFNYFVSTSSVDILGFVLITIAFAALCFTFARSLQFEQKSIREELVREAASGFIRESDVELPFKKGQTENEYQRALVCVQIAFERHVARQYRDDWQISQSKKYIDGLYSKLRTLETA